MFCLERRRLKGKLINTYKLLKGRCKGGVRLVSLVSNERTKGNEKKERQKELYDYQKTAFLTVTKY